MRQHTGFYRSPNRALFDRQESRMFENHLAACRARDELKTLWLDARLSFAEDSKPIHDNKGKLDPEACRSAVARARKLGLIH